MGVKLDLLDKKIICYLDLDSRQSATSLAKKLKASKETVNFRIKRLLKNGVIKGFYPMVDNSLIGKFFFKIFISFKEIKASRRNDILDFFASHPFMSQVLLLEGKYDVQLFFIAKENNDLMKFMASMNSFCGTELQRKEILIVDSLYRFNQKFLFSGDESKTVEVSFVKKDYTFDETSWKVLQEISNDARISVLDIAKNLDISSQLVQYHLKKLVKDKVILSNHVAINYDQLDMQHYHLTFQVNDHEVINKMIQYFDHRKKSIFATTMVGHYDFSSEIVVKDKEELRKFVDDLLEEFSEKIIELDVFLIYKEYELNLFKI